MLLCTSDSALSLGRTSTRAAVEYSTPVRQTQMYYSYRVRTGARTPQSSFFNTARRPRPRGMLLQVNVFKCPFVTHEALIAMFQFFSLFALCLVAPLVSAGPCDIYASGGTPCVAAHSTTRALFSGYSGSLYQIKRGSDGATIHISPLAAGGVANATVQDSFCASTTCLITTIFDRTGRSNHLTQAPPGGATNGTDPNGFDNLAAADGAPVTLNRQKAYGIFISPGTGYRNDATNGIAVGDAAQSMVSSGGAGSGPWIEADLEDGLFPGANKTGNASNPIITSRFVTAVVKGELGTWAIHGGNAASGSLSTFYSGACPSGYTASPADTEIHWGVYSVESKESRWHQLIWQILMLRFL
ncbi:Carbohydrate-binding module family 42 protein [Mycena sanguinolenta]|uniref:Alpha-L-arabinofuranosidase n=1 Tax=Mycena sanguinolenta TaxID=230812 RepID=A0A8H6ZBV1_9AGAR|nr:Carbohydrate-binding module family 42 protein [Mycena sanguinolenta]